MPPIAAHMNCAGAGGTGGGTARSPASPCWCLLRWVTATTSETGPVKHRAMPAPVTRRTEEHTSELQSLIRISHAVFCLKKKFESLKHTIHTLLPQLPFRVHITI